MVIPSRIIPKMTLSEVIRSQALKCGWISARVWGETVDRGKGLTFIFWGTTSSLSMLVSPKWCLQLVSGNLSHFLEPWETPFHMAENALW